uniref:Tunicamycin induced 1 n=1 Tax=Chenopodium quinoa TaxID=63459 RepID=A0A803MC68_CHEQI
MASRFFLRALASALILSMTVLPFSSALVSSPNVNPPFPKAISDLKEAVVKELGFQADDFSISGFDLRDTLVGHSVAYEFDVEIDNKVLPVKLLEDVNRWEFVDLPIFRVEKPIRPGEENGLIVKKKTEENMSPVLAPFQLAGPMELWIQDAKHMRLSLPHDVDAGVLRKVILAEGAVVTVKGAKSVSLRQPLDLPLPLNQTQNGFASGLLSLAQHLHRVSGAKDATLLSLRVDKPVEMATAIELPSEVPTLITPDQFTTLWPMTSLNGSHSNLLGLEKLLSSVLGPKANKEGSFKLLKADVSAQTYLKIGFRVEKQLKEEDGIKLEGFPEWRTKPEKVKLHFEALAKVDGDRVIPEKVTQVYPVLLEDTVAPSVLQGNVTMSKMPVMYQPSNPFTI